MSQHDRDRESAWEAARLLLDAAGLRTYLFRVEVEDDEVAIHVEHPEGGVWRHSSVRAPLDAIVASLDDPARRAALAATVRASWIERVAA